jgi:hypothetical protein
VRVVLSDYALQRTMLPLNRLVDWGATTKDCGSFAICATDIQNWLLSCLGGLKGLTRQGSVGGGEFR